MAIEKTGAKLLRRFRLPERNTDLALVRTKEGVLELYKNSKIADTGVDSFTKVAEKEVFDACYDPFLGYLPKTTVRRQFNSKGEMIGYSEVEGCGGYTKITAFDESLEMSPDVFLEIHGKRGVNIMVRDHPLGGIYDPFVDTTIKPTGKKLTPMAKRVLKFFNKVVNK